MADLYQFEAKASDDDVKTDLELTCIGCGYVVCDIEAGDLLGTLASVAGDHECKAPEPEPDGPSLTWLEDNGLAHMTNTYEFVTWEQAARALNQRILMAQDALQDAEGNAG